MATVNLLIHGKPYAIACDAGQEQRVQELGRLVDTRVREIATAGAASTEPHLIVLAALVMADEIWELREQVNTLTAQMQDVQSGSEPDEPSEQSMSAEEEKEILAAIDHLAARIDKVAARLSQI